MTRGRVWGWIGWFAFLGSLPLVAVDTDGGGEMVRGFDVRGYQCFAGAFLAPLGHPRATPLWLAIVTANVTAVLTPLAMGRPGFAAVARWSLPVGTVAAWLLLPLGHLVGVVRVHAGYYVWAAALTLLSAAVWDRRTANHGDMERP
jgi:hypothetical protein